MPTTKDLEKMTVDEKLNMLISGMIKLESVPNDILSLRNTIDGIQKDIKEIPVIQQRLDTIENDVKEQNEKSDKMVKSSEAIEESLTNTQKDVDEFKKQVNDFKLQLIENKKIINTLEAKMVRDERKIMDLSKKALEEEMSKTNVATMIEIQGVPENPKEDLRRIARQIFHDTGVTVDPKEIDEVYREGIYNKRRSRPIIVTLTKISTRNEILKHRLVIKQNPHCKNIWLNEVVLEQVRVQRNELHALHILAQKKGHDSRHILDVLVIDGITYSHDSIHRLPADLTLEYAYTREYDNAIYFNSEHVFMSNFFPCTITLADATCSSLEQAYFFLMAKDLGNIKVAELILKTQNPRKIKKLGATLIATVTWSNKAPQVMYDLLKLKYQQNPKLKERLIATGDKKLIESTMSKFWGCGMTIPMIDKQKKEQGTVRIIGKNTLGAQTEDIRRDLIEADNQNESLL